MLGGLSQSFSDSEEYSTVLPATEENLTCKDNNAEADHDGDAASRSTPGGERGDEGRGEVEDEEPDHDG